MLLRREWVSEWRTGYALGGLLLYAAGTISIWYFGIQQAAVDLSGWSALWNLLFWTAVIFLSIGAGMRSYEADGRSVFWYYYQAVDPRAFVLSRMLYGQSLVLILSALSYVLLLGLGPAPIRHPLGFFLVWCFAGSGFAFLFTLLSAIASKAGSNHTLVAVLGFPLALPLIILSIRLTGMTYFPILDIVFWKYLAAMALVTLMMAGLAMGLFPYIWRD